MRVRERWGQYFVKIKKPDHSLYDLRLFHFGAVYGRNEAERDGAGQHTKSTGESSGRTRDWRPRGITPHVEGSGSTQNMLLPASNISRSDGHGGHQPNQNSRQDKIRLFGPRRAGKSVLQRARTRNCLLQHIGFRRVRLQDRRAAYAAVSPRTSLSSFSSDVS